MTRLLSRARYVVPSALAGLLVGVVAMGSFASGAASGGNTTSLSDASPLTVTCSDATAQLSSANNSGQSSTLLCTSTSTTTTTPPTTTTSPPTTTTPPPTTTTPSGTVQPTGVSGTWTVALDDELTSDSSLDTKLWSPYWFANGDSQESNCTKTESSNVSVSDGLRLTLTSGDTCGLVSSNPDDGVSGHTGFQVAPTAGHPVFVEFEADVPASGSKIADWPALWLVGQPVWPKNGELDVMEGLGGSACYHFHDPSGGPGGCASGNFTGIHTFGAEWSTTSVTYYYDGKDVGTISSGITDDPMYLVMEESGGSYGGPSVVPATMTVEYVRVWTS